MSFIPRFSCPKNWRDMAGDDRQRFCEHCQQYVHNLESLSAGERLKLLYGEDRHVCARYRLAVRRAAPGYEEPYMRHLLKYGIGVAAASGALLTLWQLYGLNDRERAKQDYLVTHPQANQFEMPAEFLDDTQVLMLGGLISPAVPEPTINLTIEIPEISPGPITLRLDPVDPQLLMPKVDKIEIPSPQIDKSLPKSPVSRARGTHSAGGEA